MARALGVGAYVRLVLSMEKSRVTGKQLHSLPRFLQIIFPALNKHILDAVCLSLPAGISVTTAVMQPLQLSY